jgi:hypothetical protein
VFFATTEGCTTSRDNRLGLLQPDEVVVLSGVPDEDALPGRVVQLMAEDLVDMSVGDGSEGPKVRNDRFFCS